MRFPCRLLPLAVPAAAWLVAATFPGAARAARPRVYALAGGTVVASPDRRIENGTVILRDGFVESVGGGIPIPPDAVVLDVKGQFVYPGLIDASGRLPGAQESTAPSRERPGDDEADDADAWRAAAPPSPPGPGTIHPIPKVRPERRVEDALAPFVGDRRRDLDTLRGLGFLAALVAPSPGVFRGESALLLLRDDTAVSEMIARRGVAQHVALEYGSFGEGYPTSLMGAIALVRQTLYDARRGAEWSDRWRRAPEGMPRPEAMAAWDALRPVLDGTRRVIFHASDPDDALIADRLAREFGLDAIVAASGFEAEILDAVASTRRPLLFPVRFPDKPKVADADDALGVTLREMRRFLDAPSAPKRLAEAGVRFALTLRDLKSLADFRPNIRKMIDAGLPESQALAAVTTIPASLLGVDAVLGTLAPGKIANIVIADGPIFGKETRVRRVFVDGYEIVQEEKRKPKGDPSAVVDPRGTWSVVLETSGGAVERKWTIGGSKGAWTGTAETRSGTVTFERVDLEGNTLTLVFPASEGRGASEVTVVVTGDTFEGSAEFGARSVPVRGTRTAGPEGER